ncbi:hypothetical protein [Emticicia sp. C21]|uniref:hypothetical protein n=1 Tax=Emticicia sp. C21 TaxID=2302915 RepID=UPI000E3517FD|nr:hypothetical protein [Emticicia sp. C21]RFS14441.1 hypothetical protein D0T08_21455 [Emticicia sp. C21]
MINFLLSLQQAINRFINSILSLIKVLFLSDFSLKTTKATNSRCGILGNGPSLKVTLEQDIEFLNKLELIAVNLFSTTKEYTQLRPKNYLLLDWSFMNPDHWHGRTGLRGIVENTTWDLNLFVPTKMLKSAYFRSELAQNPHIKPIPFNYTIVSGYTKLTHWLFKKGLGMPQCQNVLVAALFYSLNMGFKEIYLFGADHSWHEMIKLDEDNNLVVSDTHFYGQKDYDIAVRETSYMSQQLFSLHKAFYGYEVLAKYARSIGVKVYNASAKSYVDVFEKVKVKDLKKKV